jgi:hypothetical protein
MRWMLTLTMLPLCLILSLRVGAEVAPNPATPQVLSSSFVLTVHERALSLQAEDASLRAIMEELGRQTRIDVQVHLSVDTRVTLAFAQLPLAEAIEHLRRYASIVYQTRQAHGDIIRIIVFPRGLGDSTALGMPASNTSDAAGAESKPFQFDFDPSKYLHERK